MPLNTHKPNREALRKLMGLHDVGSKVVAELLDLKPTSINQYRSRSGEDISNARLFYLKHLLELRDQQNQE